MKIFRMASACRVSHWVCISNQVALILTITIFYFIFYIIERANKQGWNREFVAANAKVIEENNNKRREKKMWTMKKGVYVDRIMPKLCSRCFLPLAFSPIKCYDEINLKTIIKRDIGEKMAAHTIIIRRKKKKNTNKYCIEQHTTDQNNSRKPKWPKIKATNKRNLSE